METLCYGCQTIIHDRYYLMIFDHSWHSSCLKCFDCGILLEQEPTCYSKHGRILCKNDYIKRNYSHKCTRCKKIIQQNEIILRAKQLIFHLKCFTCAVCNTLLHPGDHYGLKDNFIYCSDHFFQDQSYNKQIFLDDSGYQTSPNEKHKLEKCRKENFQNFSLKLSSSSDYFEIDENIPDRSHYIQQKRLRTSFKHHQLRCMRSYFNLNHNPDAKELKHLSEKTNLPKRVLQVWFQNARAKYRRNNTLLKENRTNLSSSDNVTE